MAKSRRKSLKTPEAILEAAGRVILRHGSAGLTIDAVAAEAELSKGGVLHHFASKDALIAAMVTHQLSRLKAEMLDFEQKVAPGAAAPIRAMVAHARANYATGGLPPALLAASVESPVALAGYQVMLQGTLEKLEASAGQPNETVVLFFAMLGLFLTKSLGFHTFESAAAERFLDAVAAMATRFETKQDENDS